MQDLIYWTREQLETKGLHPLLVIGTFIVGFLAIHPFQDGNGRLSRILTTLLLLKAGYDYVPYSSLESIIEANKDSYYLALRKTQQSFNNATPDFTPWLLFFLRSLKQQKQNLEQKVTRERFIYLQLSPLAAQILQLVNEHGTLGISEIVHFTKANRSTLKRLLHELVADAHLVVMGKGPATRYALK